VKTSEPVEYNRLNRSLTVDTSYRERHRIIRLLDFLTRDHLTRNQMERIGLRLQKSGHRALKPLVRRLWREQDHERLYRYTCMLDFFDAEGWLEQLVHLTLKRRDLAEEGRLPLLELLQDYGVDVSSPPFSSIVFNCSTLNSFIDRCLQDDLPGLVKLMDRFMDADESLRLELIKRLGYQPEHPAEAAVCLKMLAGFEFVETASAAIEALGTLRHGCSLTVLHSLQNLPVAGLEGKIARSIRRLGFLGFNQAEPLPVSFSEPAQLITVQVGPLDCYGVRTIWFSWLLADGTGAGVVLQLGEQDGVRHAAISRYHNLQDHDDVLEEIRSLEGLCEIGLSYGIDLLRDAIHQSIDQNYYLPPDMYVSRYLFGEADLRPAIYLPGFPVGLLERLPKQMASLLAGCEELLDESFFEGWLFNDPFVFDLAETLGDTEINSSSDKIKNLAVERLVEEIVTPQKDGLLRRLLLTADFMLHTGSSKRAVQRVLALGLSLAGTTIPLNRHPFIRRLAFNSIEMARQSLAEGFDPRKYLIYDDDEEWE